MKSTIFHLNPNLSILKIIRAHYHILVLITILVGSFYLRINNFYLLLDTDDNYRDYLVARHIIVYQEYPFVGPWSSGFNEFKNSPVYYYFLALFLLIKDDFFFLGFVGILLYLLTICVIYLLGKDIFNKNVALMASLFYSLGFIQVTDKQTSFIWQPWSALPFVYLSFLLLLKYYRRRNFLLLSLSIMIFIFSGALHLSIFSLTPLFFLIIFIILRQQKTSGHTFFLLGLYTFVTFLLLYFPVLIYYSKSPLNDFASSISQNISLLDFSNNFLSNISTLVNVFLFNDGVHFVPPKILISGVVTALLISLLYFKRNPRYLFLSIFVIQPLIFSSLIKLSSRYDIGRYFSPSLGGFFLLIAGFLNNFFQKNSFLYVIRIIVLLIIIKIIYPLPSPSIIKPKLSDATNIIHVANKVIENEVKEIQNIDNKNQPNFFNIKIYRKEEEFSSAFFWVFLEKNLNQKLTTVSDSSPLGFAVTNDNDYIFLICFKFVDDESLAKCKNTFFLKYPNYRIIKEVFNQNPFVIYASRKGFLPSI